MRRTKLVGKVLCRATRKAVRVDRDFAHPTSQIDSEAALYVTLPGDLSSSKIEITGGVPLNPNSCQRPTTFS